MKTARLALIIKNKKEISYIENLLSTFNLDVYTSLDEVKNSTYYDVILLDEVFIKEFNRDSFINSQLIVLTREKQSVTDLFPLLKKLDVFTVISLPVSEADFISTVEKSYKSFIKKKQETISSSQGKSVLVTSFSNGSGKSLIAYNLAAKLSQLFSTFQVSLVDMNTPLSISRQMLGIEDVYNWQNLTPILKEGVPDKQKIANIMYNTAYKFSLLSGPSDYKSNLPLGMNELKNLHEALVRDFKMVVYDFHTIQSSEDFSILEQPDVVLVVLDLTSQGVLQTMRGLQFIRDNYPQVYTKVKFIFNRVDHEKGRSPELVTNRMSIVPFGVVDLDTEAVNAYLENGKLFDDKKLLIDTQLYAIAEGLMKELY